LLPAERRVRRRGDFAATVRDGRRSGSGGLVVHLISTPESTRSAAAPSRAGFIVGRGAGPAVTRNRIRRRLRHLMAPRLDALPHGTTVVVRANASAANCTSAELARTLDRLLERAVSPRRAPAAGGSQ
jgi:ribonuclease P protein component